MGKLTQSTAEVQRILDESEKIITGENLKTINGQSILGSGNIEIKGGNGMDSDMNNDFNNDF